MNTWILAISAVLCWATVSCYPYDDSYGPGDIVPYGNQQELSNSRNVPSGNAYEFKRGFYGPGESPRRGANRYRFRMRQRNDARPRSLGGYRKNYGGYYQQYRRPYARDRRPSRNYNYDY